ncbi:MAG: GTP 3',8-cyclase MoaA [Bacteroidota bacterium]|nr:GTP 3',8-cyclase MoaA [Bacteroidota bacterium]
MSQLIDSFNRQHSYLRISVTDRCNLRCHYCRPPSGIELRERTEILAFDEIERVAKIFAAMGVSKIRLTGGEPLVRKDLPKLIQRLASTSGIKTLGMTTNGVLLKSFTHQLKQAGLTNLNVSLDTLRPSRFELISGRQHFDDVIDGIFTSLEAGFVPLKINVVVMGGVNADELLDFVEFVRDKPINVRFIEYMPFKFNQWNQAKFVSYQQMVEVIREKYELKAAASSDEHSVAKDYCLPEADPPSAEINARLPHQIQRSGQGVMGTISFITSMSDHFCGTCNRIRLTADGSIKSCLFHQAEVNLRSALRNHQSDEAIEEIIRSAVLQKQFQHPDTEELVNVENRSMIQIGG